MTLAIVPNQMNYRRTIISGFLAGRGTGTSMSYKFYYNLYFQVK